MLSSSDGRNAVLRDGTGACDVALQHAHVTDEIGSIDGVEVLVVAVASAGVRHGTGYRSAEERLTLRGTPWVPLVVTTMTGREVRRQLAMTTARLSSVAVVDAACAYLLLR